MRLIDADALKERLEQISVVADDMYGMGINRGLDRADTAIDEAPTVDIKTEVAKEIFAEIEKLISAKTHNYLLCGSRSQKSIEYGRQYTLRELNVEIAELKNKYIGGVGE